MINSENEKPKRDINNFAKYTGIGFQMLATIGVFVFIGYKIDQYNNKGASIYTALLGLLGVILSLIQIVKALNKNK